MPPAPNEPGSGAKAGGLWARLRGAFQASATPGGEVTPTIDAAPVASAIPVATPVRPEDVPAGTIPEAVPAAAPVPFDERPTEEIAVPALEPPALERCSYCQTPRVGDAQFCFDCGMMFSEHPAAATSPRREGERGVAAAAAELAPRRLAHRYELAERVSIRGEVERWRGWDHGAEDQPVPVILIRQPYTPPGDATVLLCPSELKGEGAREDLHAIAPAPTEEPATASFSRLPADLPVAWPGLGWEWSILSRITHPSVPRLLDHFQERDQYYLVEEAPTGIPLWDAWEDPAQGAPARFELLAQLAEGLRALHEVGAILEGLRPDIVTVTAEGRACLNDLSDLLPLPVPAEAPVQATFYTAPELVLERENADARADLYSFGAMLYALHLGRELTDMDFICQGVPKPFVERDPDAHPALARIIMKTCVREKEGRFPTDEAVSEDVTGFVELIRALRAAGRSMARVRLDIASWTTTGKVRTGNEDAFALLHAVGSRQEETGERALLILADGMGGAEAGEIASAMAIEHIRSLLLADKQFALFTGDPLGGKASFDVQACQDLFANALVDTNKHIFDFSRAPGGGKRGMGCTAEIVYVDGERVVVGHVGDSRTYLYTAGQLRQLTRDQTLVGRLVELGHLTPQEAENHPRKNELQQAIGGQPFVEPLVYHAPLRPGHWVLVCSDGLTNHVDHATLTEMIQRADSAEMLTRRLCNLANLQGGSDNCTIIAVRAT